MDFSLDPQQVLFVASMKEVFSSEFLHHERS